MAKKTVLSGCTTSGNLTLGNYIGALTHWKKLQEEHDCFYFIADLHSMTAFQNPADRFRRTLSFFAQYLALGLDPDKNTLFVQSHVHQHAELTWLLTCVTPMGNLNRMTQFKDKSQGSKSVGAGLFTYPVLMAADILLYQTDLVPVGEDQRQHLELCRDIVAFFSNSYGSGVFKEPKAFIPKAKEGARIMSLTDPAKKMSKSDENEKSYVCVIDEPKTIVKKVKAAVTDSDSVITYEPEKKLGLANLLTIYSTLSGDSIESVVKNYQGKQYGHLKAGLADLIVETFAPYKKEYERLIKEEDHLLGLMAKGKEKAEIRAAKTLDSAYKKVGLLGN